MSRGLAMKIITPLVYAVVFPVAAYFTFAAFYYAPWMILESDILFVGVPPIIFGSVYAVYGTLLLLLERLTNPTFLDHLRRSSLVYIGFLISIASYFLQPFSSSDAEDYWLFVVLGGMFLCVIAIDFSVLLAARLRERASNHRMNIRSTT